MKLNLFFSYSQEDFPDAEWVYPNMAIISQGIFGEIKISKKVNYAIKTKHQTCSEIPFNTCRMVQFYENVVKQFDCKSYMVTDGPFLKDDSYKMKDFCNVSTQLEIAKMKHNFTPKKCHQVCKRVIYNSDHELNNKTPNSPHKGTRLWLTYSNPFVEVATQKLAYSFHNLFGEVGGVLGLTLGLSGFSVITIIFDLLKKYLMF